MRRVALVLLALALPAAAQDLASGFASPPPSARPQVWWHWLNGNVTPAGITADLEAFRRVGLGGGTIANIPYANVGPAPFNSVAWHAAVKHAAAEARRLGLELGFFNCEGWSSSGGPWVKPVDAMQMLVWSQRRVVGPAPVTVPSQPLTRLGTYRDALLLAFPTPSDERLPSLRMLGAKSGLDLTPAFDDDAATAVTLPAGPKPTLTVELARPLAAGRLRLVPGAVWVRGQMELSQSADGQTFTPVVRAELPSSFLDIGTDWLVDKRFAGVTARFYRLTFEPQGGGGQTMQIAELDLMPPAGPEPIDPDTIVDLTGRTQWQAPTGDWTLLRLGYTPIGKKNHPATEFGIGLECDKLSRTALEHHFRDGIDPLLRELGPLVGSSMRYSLIDSYECGEQNWTANLPAEFASRRGYSLAAWLPALTGRQVASAARSQRFEQDFRRTVADLWNANYYGAFADLCHARGLKSSAEAYGCRLFDELRAGGLSDMPMSEFWLGNLDDGGISKQAASEAHTYGRPIVGAEAFTSGDAYNFDPAGMKAQGDAMFAAGVNRYYFHSSAGQPDPSRNGPGMVWGNGIHLTRNLTWFEQSRSWLTYLARCEYLLQAGQSQADLLALQQDDSRPGRNLPAAWDHDSIDPYLLRDALRVVDGRLVLPSGATYRVLVLPEAPLAVATLRRVAELARAGAAVFGPRPTQALGLTDYPACDAEVAGLAAELWGNIDGAKVIRHDVGRGRVYWTGSAARVQPMLDDLRLPPDLITTSPDDGLRWIHRRNAEADWYFVANPDRRRLTTTCVFRQTGRRPELWQAETGQRRPAPAWHPLPDGRTAVTMTFDPTQSWFVVFPRAAAPADGHLTDIVCQTPRPRHDIVIKSAVYAAIDGTGASIDLTAKVAPTLAAGEALARVGNETAGVDPSPFHVKQLRLEYVLDGQPGVSVFRENDRVRLPEREPADDLPDWDLTLDDRGQPRLTAWRDGQWQLHRPAGPPLTRRASVPEPLTLDGPWTVRFDPRWGGPAEALTFDRLTDWTQRPEDGVRYYSGTAVYEARFDLPAEWVRGPLCLDLGGLSNLAEVALNGRDLGVVWKAPWRVDLAGVATPGRNRLTVRVTNQWTNRLIGDRRLPEAQRLAKTSHYPYEATSPLQPSGLFGPVRVRAGVVVR